MLQYQLEYDTFTCPMYTNQNLLLSLPRSSLLPYRQKLQPLTRWKSLPLVGLGFTTHGVTGGHRHRFDTACRVGLTFPRVEIPSKLALSSPLPRYGISTRRCSLLEFVEKLHVGGPTFSSYHPPLLGCNSQPITCTS